MKYSLFLIPLLAMLITVNCSKPIGGIHGSISEGMFYHDVLLTNNSSFDLHECNLRIATIGETGEQLSERRYFAVWAKSQKVTVSLSMEKSPKKVQKVSVAGNCKEGEIQLTWLPTANR